ncbi:hypothetical protein ACN20G_32020 (plasmid) [Streptomyces sp. BI20]|uniref:hypothetical protein n=1 Tax=Streptomyces sp. BI20 TaxID=3403460 RepID=UPI003C78C97A
MSSSDHSISKPIIYNAGALSAVIGMLCLFNAKQIYPAQFHTDGNMLYEEYSKWSTPHVVLGIVLIVTPVIAGAAAYAMFRSRRKVSSTGE